MLQIGMEFNALMARNSVSIFKFETEFLISLTNSNTEFDSFDKSADW